MNRFINPEDYTYDLPQDRIAMYPAEERDRSKLLCYRKGRISHHIFSELSALLPQDSLLIFNNSRVIPARLHFRKPTGAIIEIFLLNPVLPSTVVAVALHARNEAVWKCMIGNLKRWHDHTPLQMVLDNGAKKIILTASVESVDEGLVRLQWDDPGLTLSEIISLAGKIPLPPYIHRDLAEEDKVRYQTVYSEIDGAVASSTAGLHFTEKVLKDLKLKKIKTDFITLHIGAGTFQPVKTENAIDHTMHSEQLVISGKNIDNLMNHDGPVIAVGTTSLRTLESIYWFGVAILKGRDKGFRTGKLEPYEYNEKELPPYRESLKAVRDKLEKEKSDEITGETGLYILPGYQFRICKGLITNYHLPGSTLILLVAAFAGNDWKRIYTEALMNDYRFLSYGDSSLIIP